MLHIRIILYLKNMYICTSMWVTSVGPLINNNNAFCLYKQKRCMCSFSNKQGIQTQMVTWDACWDTVWSCEAGFTDMYLAVQLWLDLGLETLSLSCQVAVLSTKPALQNLSHHVWHTQHVQQRAWRERIEANGKCVSIEVVGYRVIDENVWVKLNSFLIIWMCCVHLENIYFCM